MQQYYEKGDIQLYLGDCIEILEKAAPESVDMIFADPPYMLSNGGISCQAGKVVCVNKGKWDESAKIVPQISTLLISLICPKLGTFSTKLPSQKS